MNLTNLFFAFLSAAYIFVIFYFAGSSAVSLISPYNYYSLLHLPLYGVLTLLLALSLLPPRLFLLSRFLNIFNQTHQINEIDQTNQTNQINQINQISGIWVRLFLVGALSLIVGIADEYHQLFVPSRDASFGDVLLDLGGIILALLLIVGVLRRKTTLTKRVNA